jgi:hypothetical protein
MAKVQPNTLLDNAWDRYLGEVEEIAQRTFDSIVLPVLHKHKLYLTVNGTWGTWWIQWKNEHGRLQPLGVDELENDKEWQPVIEALRTEIPGIDTSDLGSLMKSYTPRGDDYERKI